MWIEISMKMSGVQLRSIFAVIDAQGFTGSDGRFLARELSIETKKFSKTFYFHTDLLNDASEHLKMTHSDYTLWKKTILFQKNKVHGLGMDSTSSDDLPPQMFIPVLKLLHQVFHSESATNFGIRNSQLAVILRRHQIPYVDLTIHAVSHEVAPFWGKVSACDNHEIYFPGMKCSGQKVAALWSWLEMKKSLIEFKDKLKI